MKPKIVVLMSGGVDSSVAAYLLASEGYEVVGVTLKLWECDSLTETQRQLCCSPRDVYDAKTVALKLGIKHYVLDFSSEFENFVIKEFCDKYISGVTPNPCVICNSKIKFGIVAEKISSIFATPFIATGHYAKIVNNNNDLYIAMAEDKNKDQSYFLSQVSKEMLKYIKLPLGTITKPEVRSIAEKLQLKVANKKESYEICFIPEGNYSNFLISRGYCVNKRGKIVDVHTGKFLGYHKGYACYTIGQRSGLGLKNLGEKKYVVKIDPKENVVYVGNETDIYFSGLVAKNCVVYDKKIFSLKDVPLFAKIRYKTEPALCKIKMEGDMMEVKFSQPQRAVTPGQYVVVYNKENYVVCSGEIVYGYK